LDALNLEKIWGVSVDEDTTARINKRMVQIRLCREFGWTLEYVDSLDELVLAEILGVLDGEQRLLEKQYRK